MFKKFKDNYNVWKKIIIEFFQIIACKIMVATIMPYAVRDTMNEIERLEKDLETIEDKKKLLKANKKYLARLIKWLQL